MKNNIRTLVTIVKELEFILDKKQKKRMLLVLFVIIISSGFELLGVTAILPFIQAAIDADKVMQNKYIAEIADLLGIVSSGEILILMGVLLILIYILKNTFMLFSYFVQCDYATRVQKELSIKMLKSYMKRPYTFFLNTNSSEIVRGCNEDIEGVYNIFSNLFTIVTELLTIIAIGIFIIYTDPWTAVGVLILMAVAMFGIVAIFKPVMKRAGKENIVAVATKNKVIYQAISGIKEIYVMQRKELFLGAYEEAAETRRKVQRTYDCVNNSPDRIIEGICVSGLIGIVCIRLTMNVNMTEFIPKLGAFAVAAFRILPSIGKISNRINGLVYRRPALAKVYENMQEAELYEKEREEYTIQNSGQYVFDSKISFESELIIQHVLWKYQNQKTPVLKDATLKIEKGESVAFIGASGAGKTTLADSILGLLKPQQGNIKMDGMDVYAMPMQWAKIVGYVPQSVFLLDDTVRNNIAFGIPETEVQDDMIWDALERAQLKEFIKRLPEGLETIVGERGIKFSGGQRQRIAIARALYNKPEILILDEATAALDNETETAVMESIEALQGQITMIIVAHRLTTIRNCDRIYEIKNGVAVECKKEEVLALK